jgi:endonuclease/exonuclease/phosphatase family metal-dependent hydrolase
MEIAIGTANLNNLFSRWNFSADVSTAATSSVNVEERTSFAFDDPAGFKLRKYLGKLVVGKKAADRTLIADRIKQMNLDVLAVQEVEDVDTLRRFNHDDLGGLYKQVVLVEGNDPRLIDIGLLSKLPLGAVTSWQHTPDPVNGSPLFSRDLLQVDVLSADRKRRLFTLFNNHLKSHYVSFTAADAEAEAARANELRRRQCQAAAAIIAAQMRPNSRYVVVGDMNDPPDSDFLAPLTASSELNLTSGLANPTETHPAPGSPPPETAAWTERYKPNGEPPVYTLMDQIWLSPALAGKQTGAFINRRKKVTGDGTDHDPAWVTLDL